MLTHLSLRLRIFLFFCLLAVGGVAVTSGALVIGYRRAANPEMMDAFVFSGLLSGFALVAMIVGVWLLFDENVAKPVQRLAAQMRARAHAGVSDDIDLTAARYLGDLAPAVQAVSGQLSDNTMHTAATVATETARLSAEKDRLTTLLTEIPMAIILVSPAHRIVLYDGQAAGILSQVAPPRLHASLFDYLQRDAIEAAYRKLAKTGHEVRCTVDSVDGAQSYEVRLKPLGDVASYMLILDDGVPLIAPEAPRPLVYDFDLLETPGDAAFEDRDLSDLCFVVFDTETTGLLPHKDEVVQIGAVRVLRGRIIAGEVLDMLVDPGIPIPSASSRVHKITDHMVAGAPKIAEAGRAFHHFARDAVIVAHNAPFDMAFLHRHAQAMGVAWDHPILDTVLLSAVLFGASDTHTLDKLCDRLGVVIPDALRHTALGDAQATAEVLCRMLPMLQARGMRTFGDVIAQTRRHGRLLEDLN
ncbi:3'-5' exonuclease [Sedimentitalea nanhaiensis]|uniref:DNA-directed DNA polymerase n=1 Tax=Sedimentitalea nanhaiensis TaxID=999627 RepID=A0A1I7AT00_9RHOB|nr:3'-5' exonuclease [Sedimentitalea nanhaiensis]SFT78040.1 DNA polymerase-3 subunit epsilon [Sedimentitalea nanhaiensis]